MRSAKQAAIPVFLLAAALLASLTTPVASAAPSDLDPSFGNGGRVVL